MNRARVRSSRHLRSILIMVCLWGALPTLASANAVKLFDAVRVTNVGTVTEPHMAVPFAQTQLLLICPPHPAAIISSDVDGTAGIVVDNFITVDGVNVCPIAAEGGYRNCFQRFNGGSSDAAIAYIGVTTLDISSRLSSGSHVVKFALEDHGGLLGSSDIWLVTNCFLWTQQ